MTVRSLHEIGARLKRLREVHDLSLRAVVEKTDMAVSFSMLSKVERGDVELGVRKTAILADLYGVSVDELVRVP